MKGGALTTYRARVTVLLRGLLQSYFWLICSSFLLESCSSPGPSGTPLSASFPVSVLTQAYAGEVTSSQVILIQHIFRDGPTAPLQKSGDKDCLGWCNDLFPSAQAHRNSKYSRFLRAQMAFAADPSALGYPFPAQPWHRERVSVAATSG